MFYFRAKQTLQEVLTTNTEFTEEEFKKVNLHALSILSDI